MRQQGQAHYRGGPLQIRMQRLHKLQHEARQRLSMAPRSRGSGPRFEMGCDKAKARLPSWRRSGSDTLLPVTRLNAHWLSYGLR